MFGAVFERPLFRPAFNVGGMMDVPTGKYEFGEHGESIMNGGVASMTGFVSRPNNFKTALAVFVSAMIRRVCHESDNVVYDTEGTFYPVGRYTPACHGYHFIGEIDWENDEHFFFTDISRLAGDEFFKTFMDTLKTKHDHKRWMRTTPFLDINKKPKQALYPTTGVIDSFSKLQVTQVLQQYDKNKIGDSKNTTGEMNTGRAKNELFNQLPQLCARTGTYLILTAHVKDKIEMDAYAPDKRNLASMKQNTVIGGASGMYSIPNNVWAITANKHLLNKDRMPLYPLDNKTAMEGDTDLRILTVENWRGKNGITGLPIEMIVSQTEGYQPSLSEFHYVKENEFGIGGNNLNYFIELMPDVSLSRTTVRKKIAENAKLRRALEIQAEMLQLFQFHRVDPDGVFTDPKSLREDLIKLGYDWDVLLNTRGYWVFKEDEKAHPQPFLSTMDLLRMRKGLYVPYWLPADEKKRLIAKRGEAMVQEATPAAA